MGWPEEITVVQILKSIIFPFLGAGKWRIVQKTVRHTVCPEKY
jgi:hypothetical protein